MVRYDSPSTNLRRVDQDAMNTCRRALPLLAASQEARDALEAVEALRVMKRVERPRTFGLEIDDWSGVRALLIDLVERWRSTCDAQKRARSTK